MRLAMMLPASLCAMISLAGMTAADPTLESTISTSNWLHNALEQISAERMMGDIIKLSGPTFRGRQTGTDEDRESAKFVADRFSSLRSHRSVPPPEENQTSPLPQREWKQTALATSRMIQRDPLLEISLKQDYLPLHIESDFLPILDSPSVDVRASLVFVGYGLSDPAQGVDDYAGLDVQNKIVLFLRGKPEHFKGPASHGDKERIAKENGAIAYLTATGPLLSAYEVRRGVTGKPSAFYSGAGVPDQLPGAWISTEIAEAIVRAGTQGKAQLRSLQEDITRDSSSRSFTTEVTALMRWDAHATTGTLYNVASLIQGHSPHSNETVIIGAHRDHFGQQAGLLFAGADDNASGTAVLLEVARVLALAHAPLKRSILFLSFSGEEQGLLGSRLYLSQPIVPLATTTSMINIDHAGVGNGRLTVGVTGLEKSIALEAGQTAGFHDKLDVFGFFPGGDHVPFKEAGVPTITVVSGGVHPHFHQPTDTADTINPEILKTVAQYVLALTWQLANAP